MTIPCPVPDCRVSTEEHHRVNVGLVAENAELRRRERERADPLQPRREAALADLEAFLSGATGSGATGPQ